MVKCIVRERHFCREPLHEFADDTGACKFPAGNVEYGGVCIKTRNESGRLAANDFLKQRARTGSDIEHGLPAFNGRRIDKPALEDGLAGRKTNNAIVQRRQRAESQRRNEFDSLAHSTFQFNTGYS